MSLQPELLEIVLQKIKSVKENGFERIDLSRLKLTEVPEDLLQLKDIRRIDLSNNQITELPEWFGQFSKLEVLDLKSCKLGKLFDGLPQLKSLKSLFISNNLFTELPEALAEMDSLKILFARNNKITHIPKWAFAIDSTIFDDNPVIDPPLEIYNRGIEAIKNYLKEKEKGVRKIYEAKLLIVGEPNAGKTTLVRKIFNENYNLNPNEESTLGIEIIPFNFKGNVDNEFRINIWDFGGQEIYHSTHQFFLTKRSLYILLADNRAEDTDFNYWLQTVELLSDNSPVIITLNEKQNRKKDVNASGMMERFKTLSKVFSFNLKDNTKELRKLKDYIKYEVQNLPHIGDELPKTWYEIRLKLERKAKQTPFISTKDYFKICSDIGQFSSTKALLLSEYFHDIGVFLHFQDNTVLKHWVILRPDWGTQAVYMILDDQQVIDANGYFDHDDLRRLWSENTYSNMHNELLALMVRFELCYSIEDSGKYIVPQLLKRNKPQYPWSNDGISIIKFNYEFMPKGIITRFIVRMQYYIENQSLVWREGVVLSRNNKSRAEVIQTYGKREIIIKVQGEEKKEFMAIILDHIDRINSTYKNIKVEKLVPCNCSTCRTVDDKYFFDYDSLFKFLDNNIRFERCRKSLEEIDVVKLLDNALGKERVDKRNKMNFFISFSNEDLKERSELFKHIKPLLSRLDAVVWDQTMVVPGEFINRTKYENIESANVILCLITPDYLSELSANGDELERILEKRNSSKTMVIPVWIKECDVEESPFIDLKIVDYKGKAIYSHTNIDEALVSAVKQIKAAIDSNHNFDHLRVE